jgi:hypothetical protein
VLGADLPLRIVRLALRNAQLSTIPEQGPELRDFIDNALRAALTSCTDTDTLEWIISDLDRSLASAINAAPITVNPLAPPPDFDAPPLIHSPNAKFPWADEAPTRPAFAVCDEDFADTMTPPPEQHAWVLVLSKEKEIVDSLASSLDPIATVLQISTVDALKDALAFCPTPAPIVIISAIESASHAKRIGHILPPQGRIVLWGSRDLIDSCYVHVGISSQRLVPCAAEAKVGDLAMLIRAMLGDPPRAPSSRRPNK